MADSKDTLYQLADREIRDCTSVYLKLAEDTTGLTNVGVEHLKAESARTILLAGLGVQQHAVTAEEAQEEWQTRFLQHESVSIVISMG